MSQPDDGAEVPAGGEFPVLYSQQVLVGASFYDFSLVFFQESFRGSEPVANVALPPAAAKQLAALLQDAVARFEEEHGEIALPPEPAAGDEEA